MITLYKDFNSNSDGEYSTYEPSPLPAYVVLCHIKAKTDEEAIKRTQRIYGKRKLEIEIIGKDDIPF